MPFLSTLVLSQAKREIPSWAELSPKSQEDASERRTNSKRLIKDGRATGKSICHSLISIVDSALINRILTPQDLVSLEVMVRRLFWDHTLLSLTPAWMKSGVPLSEKLS